MGRASISIRTRSPDVIITNLPGIDWVLFAVIVTAAEAALAVVVPAVVEAAGLTAAGSWAIAALVINERVRTRKYFFISNPPQIKVQSPRSKTKPQVQRDAPIAGIRAAQTAAAKSAEAAGKTSRLAEQR